jgi:hypothetical protein
MSAGIDWTPDTKLTDLVPPGYMLLDFSIQMEVMTPDGAKALVTTRSKTLTPWTALGMTEAHAQDLALYMAEASTAKHEEEED